jgi:uncharacterized protein (DUF362 family)
MSFPCAMADFVSYSESLPPLLDRIGAREVFAGQQRILLKPNLVNQSPFPVTLPVAAMAVLVDYVRSCSKAELLIGEGTGEVHVTGGPKGRVEGRFNNFRFGLSVPVPFV